MATVKLTKVKKIYDKNVVAVHDFDLDIKDKEFVVFVGPSGCGKSTTLRMIAGLEEISEGTVEIDGVVVNDLQPMDRGIAMVFQNYALYPHMTVYDNIAFGLRMKKLDKIKRKPLPASYYKEIVDDVKRNKKGEPILDKDGKEIPIKRKHTRAEIEAEKEKQPPLLDADGNEIHYLHGSMPEDEIYARVTNAAEILGITDYLMRKPRALSGGQRQRVAIGRAMVRDSKVFLMDEPLSNLDAKLRNQMRAEIILLRQKLNTTFIYVTHDQTEAMTLGDRIVIMKDGYIMQVGTPTEVFEMPKNLFVAEFIGAPKMNIMKSELICRDGQYFVKPFGVEIPVDGEKARALKDAGVHSRKVLLGVRPEHMKLADKGIPCTLEVNEMMGSELHLHVTTDDGTHLIVRVPTVDLSIHERETLVAGRKLFVTFAGKVMHFFDPESEENILNSVADEILA